jgi:hypothetical protein
MNLRTRSDKINFLKQVASGQYIIQKEPDYSGLTNDELYWLVEISERYNLKEIGPEHKAILSESDGQFLDDIFQALQEREPGFGWNIHKQFSKQ